MLCSQDSCLFLRPRLQSNEKLPENPCDVRFFPFSFFPFSFETRYALTVVTGSSSRYGLNVSLITELLAKKLKFWASNMALSYHGAVSQYIRSCLKKQMSFYPDDVTRSTFFAGQKHIIHFVMSFKKKERERAWWVWGKTMGLSKHEKGLSEHYGLSEHDKPELVR